MRDRKERGGGWRGGDHRTFERVKAPGRARSKEPKGGVRKPPLSSLSSRA